MAGRRRFTVRGRIETEDATTKTIDKVEGRFKKFGSWLSSSFVVTAGDVARAFGAVTRALTSGIKAAVEQQRASTGLASAMKTAGTFSQNAAKTFDDQSKALERSTNVARTTITELQSLAIAFTSSNDEASKLTAAALDFATGAGIAYEEALRRMGRAMQGSVDDLSKFVPGVRELTKEQLAAGKATELVAKRFSGAAKAATDSLAGAYDNLVKAVERANETIGTNVTESKELATAIRSLADEIDSGEDQWKALGGAMDWVGTKTAGIIQAFVAAAKAEIEVWRNQEMLIVSMDGVAESTDKATTSVERLTEAQLRRKRIEEGIAKQAEDIRSVFEQLGVTLEEDVNKSLKENEAVMLQLEAAYRSMLITEQDLINGKAALAASSRMLVEELHGEATEMNDVAEAAGGMDVATRAAAAGNRELMVQTMVARTALKGTERQVISTARAFDILSASMGRAAAIQAALAGGAYLSQGGTRINFGGHGGGSRLVRGPGESSFTFNQDGDMFVY